MRKGKGLCTFFQSLLILCEVLHANLYKRICSNLVLELGIPFRS